MLPAARARRPEVAPRSGRGLPGGALFWAGVAILAVRAVLALPHDYSFDMFGFGDPGASLTVYEQLAAGRLPYRDYGYPYGLLPLPLGHLWFTVFGRTPAAYLALVLACNLLVLAGITRFARALELGFTGQAWLLVTLPAFVPSNQLTPGHAIEAVLITHSIADLAGGRRPRALAFATACLFVRPSMAYLLGFAVLLAIALEAWRDGAKSRSGVRAGLARLARDLAPAAAIGSGLAAALGAWAGPTVLLASLSPATGMGIYARMGYTPSRLLREMLFPDVHSGVGYYLGTHTATVVLATLALSAGALVALRKAATASTPAAVRRSECIVVCGAMNLAYFALMVGPVQSYLYLIGMGVAALAAGGSSARWLVAALVPVAALGHYSFARNSAADWERSRRDGRLASLWSTEEMAEGWLRAREITRGEPTALLVRSSGYDRLFEGLLRPPCYYFDPGLTTEADVRRQLDVLASARYVVTASHGQQGALLRLFPEFAAALEPMRVVWRGPHFAVHRNDALHGPGTRAEATQVAPPAPP